MIPGLGMVKESAQGHTAGGHHLLGPSQLLPSHFFSYPAHFTQVALLCLCLVPSMPMSFSWSFSLASECSFLTMSLSYYLLHCVFVFLFSISLGEITALIIWDFSSLFFSILSHFFIFTSFPGHFPSTPFVCNLPLLVYYQSFSSFLSFLVSHSLSLMTPCILCCHSMRGAIIFWEGLLNVLLHAVTAASVARWLWQQRDHPQHPEVTENNIQSMLLFSKKYIKMWISFTFSKFSKLLLVLCI